MSVTVNKIIIPRKPDVTTTEPHIFLQDCVAVVTLVKDDVELRCEFRIKAGFRVDGASIPKLFQWFLPRWDKDNFTYNVGATIHDGLYIHRGFGLFTREECDDILRGIWRCSGISRFKAGVADKAVEWFAGGPSHFGNDSYGCGYLFSMEF